jgi:hypothetical protein
MGHIATAPANIAIATTKAASATGIQILVVIMFVSPYRRTQSNGNPAAPRPPRPSGFHPSYAAKLRTGIPGNSITREETICNPPAFSAN